MNIFPVVRYKFILEDKEIEALKLIGSIDCSESSNCEGCPLFIPENNFRCIKNAVNNALKVRGD